MNHPGKRAPVEIGEWAPVGPEVIPFNGVSVDDYAVIDRISVAQGSLPVRYVAACRPASGLPPVPGSGTRDPKGERVATNRQRNACYQLGRST